MKSSFFPHILRNPYPQTMHGMPSPDLKPNHRFDWRYTDELFGIAYEMYWTRNIYRINALPFAILALVPHIIPTKEFIDKVETPKPRGIAPIILREWNLQTRIPLMDAKLQPFLALTPDRVNEPQYTAIMISAREL
jgi:hypothetical protein